MRTDIKELLEAVNSQYTRDIGGPIIQTADQVTNPFILRRPTKSLGLDIAIGGGWPAGTLCQVSAPQGVGKNAMCNQTVAAVQEIYGKASCVAWVCTEMTLDKMFAHMFGVVVPMSSFEVDMVNAARADKGVPPLSEAEVKFRKRKLGEFVIVDSGSSAQRLEVALSLIESNKFQLVVIDSLASLLTEVADETELQDEPQQSSEARLITRFCQKYWGRAGRAFTGDDAANWTTVLATYQARGNRSTAKFKKSWAIGGAYALRHAKAIDVHMWNGERFPKDMKKPALGKVVKWRIDKGKAGCHEGGQGDLLYLHNEGFDIYKDCATTAKNMGVLKPAGKWWKWVSETGEELRKFTGGLDGIMSELVTDDELFWALYRDTAKRGGVECVYKL